MTLRELFNVLRRPVVPAFEELRRPTFNVDRSLLERQQAKARELGENSVKPIFVEDQPDTWVKPVDYENLPV